jgi:hypothetical protein
MDYCHGHHWNCAPLVPAYTPAAPAHFHYSFDETITIVIHIHYDVIA